MLFFGISHATNRAGVNDALTTCGACGRQDIAGAVHIRRIHRRIIVQPEMVARPHVETPVTAFHGIAEQNDVSQIPLHPFERGPLQTPAIGPGPDQCLDADPAVAELMDEIAPNKAGGPGDKRGDHGEDVLFMDCRHFSEFDGTWVPRETVDSPLVADPDRIPLETLPEAIVAGKQG